MTPSTAPFAPTPLAERIDTMDALRGFALLGILVANIEWFNRSWLEVLTAMPAGLSGIDHAVAWFVYVFVLGKFITLFSLLFGMGFALMHERARDLGRSFVPVYLRRLAVLLCIGIAHALLQWVGDILQTYALAGLLLLSCRNWQPRTQLRVGLGVWLAFIALGVASALFGSGADPQSLAAQVAETQARIAHGAQVYATGDFMQVTAQRLDDMRWYWTFLPAGAIMSWSLFLVGAGLVRSGVLHRPHAHRAFWRRLAVGGTSLGLAAALASASTSGIHTPLEQALAGPDLGGMLHSFASLPLALGYMALVVQWTARSPLPQRLFAPMGRMALTNYLMQSLVCSLLFFGYGLALWGKVPYAGLFAMALAIYALQMAFSRWWMERFRFGPMEWLWRSLTYLKLQPMRGGGAAKAAGSHPPP